MDSVDNRVPYRSKATIVSMFEMISQRIERKKRVEGGTIDDDVSVSCRLHLFNTMENYEIFRECLSNALVTRSEKPKKKGKRKEVVERTDPEELAEFVDVHLSNPITYTR